MMIALANTPCSVVTAADVPIPDNALIDDSQVGEPGIVDDSQVGDPVITAAE